ncbi:MAG: hypothetical protein HeimC2_30170 [Candidatus Heimdallarchaeota archaeon LC_2]|nr:MAG: hypothetical protein HeimC2_30170 [Candidatus Heimdallarchaeota archaeon LC_2]
MNKSIISLIVLFYILVSTQSIGATDYTKIGVSNGDGFTFFLDEYTLTDNDITTHEMFLGTDERTETELYVSEGEEFRMVVGDETPVINEEEGEATFLVIFETPSNTGQVHESLDGSFISSTDWAGVREEIDSIFTEILSAGENDFTIIDTSSEFGMNVNFTTFESEDYGNFSTSFLGEVRFDKSTGVMKRFDLTTANTIEFLDDIEMHFEHIKMHFIGDGASDGLSLPGFELYIGFFSLFTYILLTKKKQS